MKKIGILLISLMFLLTGCFKENKDDVIKDLSNSIKKMNSYEISGNMEISNDEEKFSYNIDVSYLKGDYYKVTLINQTNNHKQIILKNKDDVYVISPDLNKSFKFQSEWPENSSQAYLLSNIINDISSDKNSEVEINDNGYIIKSKVNYPNNEDLLYQKIYLNTNKDIESVEVYNKNDIVKIKVEFNKINKKPNIKEEDFKLDNFVKEAEDTNVDNKEKEQNKDDKTCTNNNCDNKKTVNIENIIYPLYIPSNTYLTSSEKVETTFGNRVILTFGGEKNFVLIEEATLKNDVMEIIPVYGEPLMLDESIGALSANSLTWDRGNISYYLASTELSISEITSIANSLGNNTLVANTK